MPYKHIAAHLKKTELACRLHYHQMAYGSNRRNRHDSVSSTASARSLLGLRDCSPDRTIHSSLSPVRSPPSSPEQSSPKTTTTSPFIYRSHVPILPKPGALGATTSSSQAGEGLLKPKSPPDLTFGRNHTQQIPTIPTPVNIDKLCRVYEANRAAFWSAIASEYSPDSRVTGTQLEEIFWLSCFSIRPHHHNVASPTHSSIQRDMPSTYAYETAGSGPNRQQHDGAITVQRSVPSSTGTMTMATSKTSQISSGVCSVSALLTEEKEIRPFRECV